MALALPMLLLTTLLQIPDGVQAIAMSVLRGVNDTRIPAIVAITSFCILGVAVGALAGFLLASARPASRAVCCLDSARPHRS